MKKKQDSWEDEDEEAKEEEKSTDEVVVKKSKPQKNLRKTIEEKEVRRFKKKPLIPKTVVLFSFDLILSSINFLFQRLKQEQEEAKAREREANMTPEERLAEKLRIQKVQEESDLRAAMDTFGVSEIDAAQPKTKAELTELADAISKKACQFKHLADFPGFLEELVRNVCANRK